jgi:hypothetical protein
MGAARRSNVTDIGIDNPKAKRQWQLIHSVMLVTVPVSLLVAAAFADALAPIGVLSTWLILTLVGGFPAGLSASDQKDHDKKWFIIKSYSSITLPGIVLLCVWSLMTDYSEDPPTAKAPAADTAVDTTPGYAIDN